MTKLISKQHQTINQGNKKSTNSIITQTIQHADQQNNPQMSSKVIKSNPPQTHSKFTSTNLYTLQVSNQITPK